MKKIFNILMLACIMLTTSCSSDELLTESATNDGNKVVISVAMPDQNDSRVTLFDTHLVWDEGDQIFLIPLNEDGIAIQPVTTLSIISGAGTNIAEFSGDITDAPKYRLVYKTNNVKIDDQGAVSMDYSTITQSALDNNDHLSNNFLIMSDVVTKEAFQHFVKMTLCNAMLRVNLRSLPENLTSITDVKWILNYGEADETVAGAVKFSGTLPLMCDAQADRYITIPVDVTKNLVQHAGKKMALQFNGSRTRTVTVTVPNEKKYSANKMYTLSVSLIAEEGQKTMNEWDVENDYPLDNHLWVKTVNNDPVNGEEIRRRYTHIGLSLRGYHIYSYGGPITEIHSNSFGKVKQIIEIVFPNTIEVIDNGAFYETEVTKALDFRRCTNLWYIGAETFSNLSSEGVLLPLQGADLSLNRQCFQWYHGKTFIIPQTVTYYERNILLGCSGLENLFFLAKSTVNNGIASEFGLKNEETKNINLTLRFEWYNTKTPNALIPKKTLDNRFLWNDREWKSISFVEVNADGTPGKTLKVWADKGNIDDDPVNSGTQDGGALTSTGDF